MFNIARQEVQHIHKTENELLKEGLTQDDIMIMAEYKFKSLAHKGGMEHLIERTE